MTQDGSPRKILVVGIGNQFRGDDAFGFAVLEQLRGTFPQTIDFREFEGDGVALMQAWKGYEAVVLVDCIASGAAPGTLFRLDANDRKMPTHFFRSSSHLFGVAEAVEMARTLHQLPAFLVIFGVEGENFDAGSDISPSVAKAIDLIANQIHSEIAAITAR